MSGGKSREGFLVGHTVCLKMAREAQPSLEEKPERNPSPPRHNERNVLRLWQGIALDPLSQMGTKAEAVKQIFCGLKKKRIVFIVRVSMQCSTGPKIPG